MPIHTPVTPELVAQLGHFGALPLSKERLSVVAPLLDAWLKDANQLSEKMSAAQHQTLVPATVFTHPGNHEGEGAA